MNDMFQGMTSFNGDISNWDVSIVKKMNRMFSGATSFNVDISKWDVSRVTGMDYMFSFAMAFDRDLSNWDVSSVTNMDFMFNHADKFKHSLCGAAWVNSRASKTDMFYASRGTISPTKCQTQGSISGATFSAHSLSELKNAIRACLSTSPKGDCSMTMYGPMGDWDVSRVSDMRYLFAGEESFNADISNWDVRKVRDMTGMFTGAKMFNGDISKWDVSRVTSMDNMFWDAKAFKQALCGSAWVYSDATRKDMFKRSFGTISSKVCHPISHNSMNRELIRQTTEEPNTGSSCPKCGSFKKSGRTSCCAPGGAWFKSCGGSSGNGRFSHTWVEGVQACKPTVTAASISVCDKCGSIGKSGKASCCGRGGSWFRNCGSVGNAKFQYTWYEGIQACSAQSFIGQQLDGDQEEATATTKSSTILVTSPPVDAATGCEKLLSIIVCSLLLIVAP